MELDYAGVFDAVILIYCDYPALIPDERKTLLGKVYKALKPGGVFILDVNTTKYFAKKSNKTSWTLCENGGYWNAERYICLESTYLYENNTVVADQYVVITNSGIKKYLNWFTEYSIEKLHVEVYPFGFKVKNVYDDVWGSLYTGEAETLGFILERGAV